MWKLIFGKVGDELLEIVDLHYIHIILSMW